MQAAIAHAQFENVHPFADGNGRVGRCLIHTVLRRRGLAPNFVHLARRPAARRDAYFAGLVSTAKASLTLVSFFADAHRRRSDASRGTRGVDRLARGRLARPDRRAGPARILPSIASFACFRRTRYSMLALSRSCSAFLTSRPDAR